MRMGFSNIYYVTICSQDNSILVEEFATRIRGIDIITSRDIGYYNITGHQVNLMLRDAFGIILRSLLAR